MNNEAKVEAKVSVEAEARATIDPQISSLPRNGKYACASFANRIGANWVRGF